jgi:hypothetical protein
MAAKTGSSAATAGVTVVAQGALVVCGLLAVGELLRLGILIERNTRPRRAGGDDGKRESP